MPRSGIVPANAFTAASVTPAVSGFPGPGENTSASGRSAAMPAQSIASFFTTRTSAPSMPNSCTML